MRKKLMILGAGIYQVPLILKAKAMGLETLVVSIGGHYPGILLADRFFELDTRDVEGILKLAREEAIDGICTSGTDVAVRTIGYVCSQMGLPGISYEAAKCVTDKALMKDAFVKGGVSTAAFERIRCLDDGYVAAEKMGYPVVVKAVDSSGSRGIHKVDRPEQLENAYRDSMQVTKRDYVLVEAFIDAEEIGVDAFVGADGLEIFLPHQKFVYKTGGVTVPVGHRFPYEADKKQIDEIERQIALAAKAAGLKNCPLNADVFVKDDKVWIIEIGGRTGATCIPELISLYKGYDWYEKIILAALGEAVDFASDQENPCMAKLIFSPVSGKITDIHLEKIQELEKEGVCVQLDLTVGDWADALANGTDRTGHVIAAVNEEKTLDKYAARLRSCVELEQGNLQELWEEHERKSVN